MMAKGNRMIKQRNIGFKPTHQWNRLRTTSSTHVAAAPVMQVSRIYSNFELWNFDKSFNSEKERALCSITSALLDRALIQLNWEWF